MRNWLDMASKLTDIEISGYPMLMKRMRQVDILSTALTQITREIANVAKEAEAQARGQSNLPAIDENPKPKARELRNEIISESGREMEVLARLRERRIQGKVNGYVYSIPVAKKAIKCTLTLEGPSGKKWNGVIPPDIAKTVDTLIIGAEQDGTPKGTHAKHFKEMAN